MTRAVLATSPSIDAAAADVLAASGRAWQAGLYPNPTLELSRDGPTAWNPLGRAEIRVGVTQPVVVSDRRERAVTAALTDRDAREAAVAVARHGARAAARSAFVELVHLRDEATLRRDLLAVAGRTLDLARERVAAKVAVTSEALRPELEVRTLESALAGVDRRRDAAEARLETLLGGADIHVERLVRPAPGPLPDATGAILAALARNPALDLGRQLVEVARAELALARTAARPDISVRASFGRDFDGNDFLAEVGVEIPLAVHDAGQGAVLEAQALVSKARSELAALEREIAVRIGDAVGASVSARAELNDLRARVVPLAEKTLEATRDEHRSGRQEFLAVLDAQRTLLDARLAILGLERDVALADADVLTLTGDPPCTLASSPSSSR
ncbi:MAG: TolC family protein [Planctomycetes bacterium]|nr:TolC family protein [Planctomycetota bacterium]